MSSDALYLLARGSLSYGTVSIKDSNHGGDKVRVDVIVNYYSEDALDRAKVCELRRGRNDRGVGMFVS